MLSPARNTTSAPCRLLKARWRDRLLRDVAPLPTAACAARGLDIVLTSSHPDQGQGRRDTRGHCHWNHQRGSRACPAPEARGPLGTDAEGHHSDTTIANLATQWLAFLRDEGRIEATAIHEYERVLTKVVIPELAACGFAR